MSVAGREGEAEDTLSLFPTRTNRILQSTLRHNILETFAKSLPATLSYVRFIELVEIIERKAYEFAPEISAYLRRRCIR